MRSHGVVRDAALPGRRLVEVERLTKAFDGTTAVDDVSFTVDSGEVLAVLGPNGAGKSTLMRMVTGWLVPTSGSVRIGGYDMRHNPLGGKRLIGYLPENAPCYEDMTVRGFLDFAADARGLTGERRRHAVSRVVELCSLDGVLGQTIETLSKGYRHRTCLAQSLIDDPPVLVLDEPTDGLDPNQKHDVRALISRMGAHKAIVFTTHILEEVEAMATRVVIIDRGRIVANGTPQELKARSDLAGAVRLRLRPGGIAPAELAQQLMQAPGARRGDILQADDAAVELRVCPLHPGSSTLSGGVALIAVRERWPFEAIHVEEGRLEDVFRSITLTDAEPLSGGHRPDVRRPR